MKKVYLSGTLVLITIFLTVLIQYLPEAESPEPREAIEEFFKLQLERKAGPTGNVEPADVYQVEQQIASMGKVLSKTNSKSLSWSELGPDNVGGRTLGILADNQHPNWIYAGAASGGLWLSKTGGTSWYHISNNSDFYENLCVSSITQTPDGDIYFSTGEEFIGGLRGGGVWRKDKDSTEFRRLNKTNPAVSGGLWNNTYCMAASHKKDRIFAGNEGGLYISDDNGNTWVKAPGSVSGNCNEVKADSDGTIMAIINKKIYISTNDGNNFTLSSSGLPSVGSVGRSTIAIASKNTNYLYTVYSKTGTNDCYGAYRSTDKGATWKLIQIGGPYFNPFNDQGWYDICCAVDPENENHLFVGGVTLWEWYGPGSNFVQTQTGGAIHADLHNITMDRRTNPYTIIIGCDGGIYKSSDRAKTFYPAFKLYTTTQFYSMAASRDDHALGGTQDNGSLYIDKKGNTVKSSYRVLGGDGFFNEIAWHDTNEIKFVEYQYAELRRNRANSAMNPFYDAKATAYIIDGKNGQFSSPFTLWEHPTNDTLNHFAIGVEGAIYYTNNATNFVSIGGPKWYQLATFGGNVNCVEFSADGDMLFFGVGNALYRVKGLNTAVFDDTYEANPAAHGITFTSMPFNSQGTSVQGVACDPKYPNRLLIATGNYGFADHVFISRNANDVSANVKFTNITNNLPGFPCYDAAIDYTDSSTFLLGTEYGLYASFDGGQNWSEQNNGLARVAIYQVRQYIDTRQPWTGSTYYLATFGRGMYRSTSLTTGIKNTPKKEVHPFSVFPNPASDFINVHGLHEGLVKIYNMQGQCVLSQTLNTNGNLDVQALPKGNYILELNENGQRNITKFIKL